MKHWANVIFQHRFQNDLSTFKLWLLSNYCELFNYPWLKYVKLIIGARDQRLLMSTKWGVMTMSLDLVGISSDLNGFETERMREDEGWGGWKFPMSLDSVNLFSSSFKVQNCHATRTPRLLMPEICCRLPIY